MNPKRHACTIISDFNVSTFAGYLSNDLDSPDVTTTVAPFGQVYPALFGDGPQVEEGGCAFAVVWTRPQIIPSFAELIRHQRSSLERILEEVDTFADALLKYAKKVSFGLVPSWVIPTLHRGLTLSDMTDPQGVRSTLMQMNMHLAHRLREASNLHLIDSSHWIESAGKQAFDSRLWYAAKVPFGNAVIRDAALDVKAALRGMLGDSRKLIVLDLDNTLWGGIVGEVGVDGLRLGGHDPIGEAFVDFQIALKALQRRGILLAVASKNEEAVALEAMQTHPEMILRPEDLVGWRINWQDKAANITALVRELNLGLQSVVFIDDTAAERGRVSEALPEVLVPDWPVDPMMYVNTLLSLRCFDSPSLSEEDGTRTESYVADRKRREERSEVGSQDDWLKSLELKLVIDDLNQSNLPRAAQLLNKTNQMNLSTRRLSEAELSTWSERENRKFWTFRVSDRFGDAGLTGLASCEVVGSTVRIVDFILSCRVFGRRIEEYMLAHIMQYAADQNTERVEARYVATNKNKPCYTFWSERSGFEEGPDDLFSSKTNLKNEWPELVAVITVDTDQSDRGDVSQVTKVEAK